MKKIIGGAKPRDNSDNGPGRGATQVITRRKWTPEKYLEKQKYLWFIQKNNSFVDNIAIKPVAVNDASKRTFYDGFFPSGPQI